MLQLQTQQSSYGEDREGILWLREQAAESGWKGINSTKINQTLALFQDCLYLCFSESLCSYAYAQDKFSFSRSSRTTCLMWLKLSSDWYYVHKTEAENKQVFSHKSFLIPNCKASDPLGLEMKWEIILYTGEKGFLFFTLELRMNIPFLFLFFLSQNIISFLYFFK